MPNSLARIVPGLDKLGGRAHVCGMAIEWTMNGDAWLARIDWVEIRVFWDGGQWRSTAKALSMHHCLGTGTLAQAQREALRLLENALWGPVKALIAAREAAK